MNKRNSLILVAAAIVVAFLWYSTIWSSQDKTIAAANTKTAQVVDQTKSLKSHYNALLTAQKDEASNRAEFNAVAVAVPDAVNLGAYLRTMDALSAQAGVTLSGLSQTPPSAGGSGAAGANSVGLASSNVDFVATGTYHQVLDFLVELQQNKRLIIVDAVTMVPGKDLAAKGQATSVGAHITGRIFTMTSMDEADLAKAATTTTTTGAKK